MIDYSSEHSYSLRSKYPQCYPVILVGDINLTKTKLLININMSITQLLSYIRQYNKLNRNESYFIFTTNNVLLIQSSTLTDVYLNHKSDNDFLYLIVKKESTFG